MGKFPLIPGDGEELVFTTKITLKNGKVLYAKDVGKKVFVFIAPKRDSKKSPRK